MRSKAAVCWFVVSMVLGVALVVQWDAARRKQTKLEALQVQVEKSASSDADVKVKALERERLKLIGELRAAEYELNTMRMASAAGMGLTNMVATTGANQNAASGGQGKENPAPHHQALDPGIAAGRLVVVHRAADSLTGFPANVGERG